MQINSLYTNRYRSFKNISNVRYEIVSIDLKDGSYKIFKGYNRTRHDPGPFVKGNIAVPLNEVCYNDPNSNERLVDINKIRQLTNYANSGIDFTDEFPHAIYCE